MANIIMYCIKRGWDEHFAVWYASWYENIKRHNDDVRLIVFECGGGCDARAYDLEVMREVGLDGSVVLDWNPRNWVGEIERIIGRSVTDDDFCIKRSSIDYALARLEALDWLGEVCKGSIICHVDLDTLFVRPWVGISKQLRYWVDNGAEVIGVDEWCCSKEYLIDMHPKGWGGDKRTVYINGGLMFFVNPGDRNVTRFKEWLYKKGENGDVSEFRCLEQDWVNDHNEFDPQRIGVLPSKYNFTWNHLREQGYGYPIVVHYYGDIKPWGIVSGVPTDSCVWKYGFWEEYLGWLSRVRWLVGGEFYNAITRRILTVTSELRGEMTEANKGIVGER